MRCALAVVLGVFVLCAGASAGTSDGAQRGQSSTRRSVSRAREGLASYYHRALHGRRTASGTRLNMNDMVAAHPTYPFGTVVRVTNLDNGRSVRVRVVDRGPVRRLRKEGVIIDVSHAAAKALGFLEEGRARVRLEVLERTTRQSVVSP